MIIEPTAAVIYCDAPGCCVHVLARPIKNTGEFYKPEGWKKFKEYNHICPRHTSSDLEHRFEIEKRERDLMMNNGLRRGASCSHCGYEFKAEDDWSANEDLSGTVKCIPCYTGRFVKGRSQIKRYTVIDESGPVSDQMFEIKDSSKRENFGSGGG